MRNELVRKELEKKYTHVTFVRTVSSGLAWECGVWTVNQNMEKITVRRDWKIEDILWYIELSKMENVNRKSEKYILFLRMMKDGKLPLDYTLYKKTTLKKLKEIANQ